VTERPAVVVGAVAVAAVGALAVGYIGRFVGLAGIAAAGSGCVAAEAVVRTAGHRQVQPSKPPDLQSSALHCRYLPTDDRRD